MLASVQELDQSCFESTRAPQERGKYSCMAFVAASSIIRTPRDHRQVENAIQTRGDNNHARELKTIFPDAGQGRRKAGEKL
jgi:hypothetical protein